MHLLVKEFFTRFQCKQELPTFCAQNNLNYETVRSWKRQAKPVTPTIESFDRALNQLGFELKIVLKKDAYK